MSRSHSQLCQANALTTVLAREARIGSGQCSDSLKFGDIDNWCDPTHTRCLCRQDNPNTVIGYIQYSLSDHPLSEHILRTVIKTRLRAWACCKNSCYKQESI
eukprot:sb/3478344/